VAKDVTLLIKLNDQASGKISKITNSTKQLERAANGAQNSIRRTNKGIRDTGRAADKASKGVNNLGKAVRGLVAGFGLFQAGKFVIFKTAELERQTKSLEVLTGSLGNARSIIKELQQFGAVTPFTSAELIETAKRLKAFGFETEQIVDVTKRLADVAGATGADLGGIATAFGQIQAKGRLQGEELLQLQERGIGLQDELIKMYGFTAEEFRKALEGGRISADAVNVALQNITNTGGKYANGAIAQSETLAGKFSTLIDNITVLAQNIGKVLAPVLKDILGIANNALSSINRLFTSEISRELSLGRLNLLTPGGTLGDVQGLTQFVSRINVGTISDEGSIVALSNELKTLRRQAEEVGASINRSRAFKITDQEKQAFEGLQGVIQSQIEALGLRQKLLQEVTKPDTSPIPVPELLNRTTKTIQPSGAKTDPLASLKNQVQALKDKVAIEKQSTPELKRQQKLLNDIAALTSKRTEDNAVLVDEAIKLTGELFHHQEQTRKNTEEEKRRKKAAEDALKAQQEEAKRLQEIYSQVGQTIEQGITGAIMGAIDGTKTLSQSLSGILNQLANIALQQSLGSFGFGGGGASGLFGAIAGIFGGGGGFSPTVLTSGLDFSGAFANGGRPAVGKAALVGERGPELFVPNRGGTIIPNDAMGGANVTVNVDASGSSVEGDADQASQLGRAIGFAVQQELVKQKRPGGLLAS